MVSVARMRASMVAGVEGGAQVFGGRVSERASGRRGREDMCRYGAGGGSERAVCFTYVACRAPAPAVPRCLCPPPTLFHDALSPLLSRSLYGRPPQRSTAVSPADMIRRPPTQIPMTDMDVQQVRDAIARQKAEAAVQQGQSATPAQATAPTPLPQPYHHPDELKKKRDGMTRNERLGLR